ncbi:hypothetical protein KB221_01700 [Aquidulcibacter paucihalophilus]|nr:hypothetical protein KB221_01700 [Aquidulcibacter paucihalophilus]
MKSPNANAVIQTAYALSAAATFESARRAFPALCAAEPDVLAGRLCGSHVQDAIDLQLSYRQGLLSEVRVRATIWSDRDTAKAARELRQYISRASGQSVQRRGGRAPEKDRWTVGHETVALELRQANVEGFLLGLVILTRTFDQPDAAQASSASLSGLFGAAPRAPLLTLPARNSRQVFPQAVDDRPVWGEKVIQVAKLNWPRAWADGPYVPKWKTGRQRVGPSSMHVDGPLFYRSEFGDAGGEIGPRLAALATALDTMAARSDWEPVRHCDEADIRHHSSRWWWLGGGVMLHVYVQERSMFDPSSSHIIIDAYQELDGPPAQSARPTPTVHDVTSLVSKATSQALGSTVDANSAAD